MKILLLVAFAAMCRASEYDTRFVPRVMFWCGKVNQHVDLSTGEWTTDRDGVSGCIPTDDKSAILDYCRKVYPHKDITNVVEDRRLEESSTWCEQGNENCHYESRRLSFRCVVGHFETRALNVPDGCAFSHFYNDNECLSHNSLHEIAMSRCESPTPVLRDFGKIVECGLDRFRGVEYVCCPEEHTKPTEAIAEEVATTEVKAAAEAAITEKTAVVTEKVMPFLVRDEVVPGMFDAEQEEATSVPETDPVPTMPPVPILIHDDSIVNTLASTLNFKDHCDRKLLHKLYYKQRQHLDGESRKRMTTVLELYHRSLQASRELKEREPSAASSMEMTVKSKYRKLVEDSERMAAVDYKTLKARHQQDLQKCYQERLCKGLQMFMTVLSETPAEARRILDGVNKVLEQELEDHRTALSLPVQPHRLSQKQRHHTILRINRQIKYARQFLVAANGALETGVAVFPGRHYDCPLSVASLPAKTEAPESEVDIATTESPEETKRPAFPDFTGLLEPGPVILPEPEDKEELEKVSDFTGLFEPGPVILPEPEDKEEEEEEEEVEKVSESVSETKSDEKSHDSGIEWKRPKTSGFAHSNNDSPVNDERNSGSSSKSSSYLGLAIGLAVGAAVMVISLLALYAWHQRRRRGNYEVDLVDDDELAKQREEDELQENGYENPTYKFFQEMDDGDE